MFTVALHGNGIWCLPSFKPFFPGEGTPSTLHLHVLVANGTHVLVSKILPATTCTTWKEIYKFITKKSNEKDLPLL